MKPLLILPVFIVLLFQFTLVGQNCPEFQQYNHVYVSSDYEPCGRNFLIHKELTFHFPAHSWTGWMDTSPEQNGSEWTEVTYYLRVGFDDGTGGHDIPPSKEMTVNYPSYGTKNINITKHNTYNESSEAYGAFSITLNQPSTGFSTPDETLTITTSATWTPPCENAFGPDSPFYSSDIGKARAYIRYAPGHDQLVKPIIFVDGLDPSDHKIVDPAQGSGESAVIRYGSNGWDVITMGGKEALIDEAGGDYSEFEYYPTAFDDFQDEGYDIVFLDFERGADYIQKNGRLLIELLTQINDRKVPDPETGIQHGNIVIGASMGGQVARWALATMEEEGVSHCTQTYLSFDSPHKGAHISLGLQAAAWFYYKTGTDETLWKVLNSPAPHQLLFDHFGAAYADGKITTEAWAYEAIHFPPDVDIDYGCLRASYVAEMEALGYPQYCRNIAISCGSEIGVDQGYNAGDKLYEASLFINEGVTLPWGNVFQFGIWGLNGGNSSMNITHATPSCGTPVKSNFTQRTIFGSAFPRSTITCNEPFASTKSPYKYHGVKVMIPSDTEFPSYTNAPGCFRSDLFALKKDMIELLTEKKENLDADIHAEIVNDRHQICFMPTMTALDINWEMTTENMWKNIEEADIIANNLTPFEAYYAPNENLKHVELDEPMASWVQNEFERTEFNLGTTLPNAEGATYNFGHPQRRQISGVTVESGGHLRVNDVGNTGYGDEPATQQYNFKAYTAGCAGNITVGSGGYFILGNDEVPSDHDQKAEVTIRDGSVLHVQAGGTLRLVRGSKLIVASGSTLEIDADANIELWWNISNIHIEEGGILRVNGEFNLIGSGYFQFDEGNVLSFGPDADGFHLDGQGLETRFIHLNKNAKLNLSGHSMELMFGKVTCDEGAGIEKVGQTLHLAGVALEGMGANILLEGEDMQTVQIMYSQFESGAEGLKLTGMGSQQGGVFSIQNSSFSNLERSLWVNNVTNVTLSSCTFDGSLSGNEAIFAQSIQDFKSSYCDISHYPLTAVWLSNIALYRMQGGMIENAGTGIHALCLDGDPNKSNILLTRGATIQNCQRGIYVAKGGVDDYGRDYGMVSMKCSKLINNTVGISGVDVLLDLDGCMESEAECDSPMSNQFILGMEGLDYFDVVYVDRSDVEQVFARHNYWLPPPNNSANANGNYRLRKGEVAYECDVTGPANEEVALVEEGYLSEPPTSCWTETPGPYPTVEIDAFKDTPYECGITTGDGSYLLDQQYRAATWHLRNEELTDARGKYQAIAAIPDQVRNDADQTCRNYIDIARVMAHALKNEAAGEYGSNWAAGTYIPQAKGNPLLRVWPNPAESSVSVWLEMVPIG